MSLRSLTTSVQPELYDRYKAALPDGETVNSHLRSLVEQWLARPLELAHSVQLPPDTAVIDMGSLPVATVPIDSIGGAQNVSPIPDPGCLHPRALLYRDGRNTRCQCGRIVA